MQVSFVYHNYSGLLNIGDADIFSFEDKGETTIYRDFGKKAIP